MSLEVEFKKLIRIFNDKERIEIQFFPASKVENGRNIIKSWFWLGDTARRSWEKATENNK